MNRGFVVSIGCACLLAFLAQCAKNPVSKNEEKIYTAKITGKIVDKKNKGLAGVLVTSDPDGQTTVSLADGSFELSDLTPQKPYRLYFQKIDYRDTSAGEFSLAYNETKNLQNNIKMSYRFASLSGAIYMRDSVTKAQYAGVKVAGQIVSDPLSLDGTFLLTRVVPGQKIRVYCAKENYGFGYADVALKPEDSIDVDLFLDLEGGTVRGTIVDDSGRVVANAEVSALGGLIKTRTDSVGAFTLRNVPSTDRIELEVARDSLRLLVGGVEVFEKDSARVNVVFGRNPSLVNQSGIRLYPSFIPVDNNVTDTAFVSVISTTLADTVNIRSYVWTYAGKTDTTVDPWLSVPIAALDLAPGVSVYHVSVYCLNQDGQPSSTADISILVTQRRTIGLKLSSLTAGYKSGMNALAGFNPDTLLYAIAVPDTAHTVTIAATAEDTLAAITVYPSGRRISSGSTHDFLLSDIFAADSVIVIAVSSPKDTTGARMYRVKVGRGRVAGTITQMMFIADGKTLALDPSFTAGTTVYRLTLPGGTRQLNAVVQASASAKLRMLIIGKDTTFRTSSTGSLSATVPADSLPDTLNYRIVIECDSTSYSTSVTVSDADAIGKVALRADGNRIDSNISFQPGVLSYAFQVPFSAASLSITPQTGGGAGKMRVIVFAGTDTTADTSFFTDSANVNLARGTGLPLADFKIVIATRTKAYIFSGSWKSPPIDTALVAGMRPVLSKGVSFFMGDSTLLNAKPVHKVTFTYSFYMDTAELTQKRYQSVAGSNPSVDKTDPLKPVTNVTWFDAVRFCMRLNDSLKLQQPYDTSAVDDWKCDIRKSGYRLPTEAEWEFACRAGTAGPYYWGAGSDSITVSQYAWYNVNSGSEPQPVGGKKSNVFGLYDMSGNVMEWCQDRFQSVYPTNVETDPVGPSTGTHRVLRGGAYLNDSSPLKSAYRGDIHKSPDIAAPEVGFRMVITVP